MERQNKNEVGPDDVVADAQVQNNALPLAAVGDDFVEGLVWNTREAEPSVENVQDGGQVEVQQHDPVDYEQQVADEQQTGHQEPADFAQTGEDIASAFSDDADEGASSSPVAPLQQQEQQPCHDDYLGLWSDDEEERAPPPRPVNPLSASQLEIEMESKRPSQTPLSEQAQEAEQERRAKIAEEFKYGPPNASGERPIRPFSGYGSADNPDGGIYPNARNQPSVRRKKTKDFKPGRSSLSQVTQTSAITLFESSTEDSDPQSGTGLPRIPEEEENKDQKPDDDAEYSDSDYGDDPWGGYEDGDDTHLADLGGENTGEAEGGETDAPGPRDEADVAPNDTPINSPATEPVREAKNAGSLHSPSNGADRPTSPDLRERNGRPSSPINFVDPDPLADYFSDYFNTPEEEFDALTGLDKKPKESADNQQQAGEPAVRPSTPPSAEILEQVTGMDLERGRKKFDRLVELSKRPGLLQNPQRALEMKRQALLYNTGQGDYAIFGHEEGAARVKINTQAQAAWASAAAHLYRHQREQWRDRAREWEEYGKYQLETVQYRDKQIAAWEKAYNKDVADAEQEGAEWRQAAESANQSLHEAREDRQSLEHDLAEATEARHALTAELDAVKANSHDSGEAKPSTESAQDDVGAMKAAKDKADAEVDRLKKALKRALPFYEMAANRKKNPPKSAETQTSPILLAAEFSAPMEQTEMLPNQIHAETQTDAQTDDSATLEDRTMDSTETGTQTDPEQRTDTTPLGMSAFRSMLNSRGEVLPRLRFEIDEDVQPRLLPEIVRWINASHQSHGRNPLVPPVTEARIEKLLQKEPTYEDFVTAIRMDETVFRPDHLAQYIEWYINENNLGRVPLAIIQLRRRVDHRELVADTKALYDEIASQQATINHLEDFERRAMNADAEAVQALQGSLVAAHKDMQAADERANNANKELCDARGQLSYAQQNFARVTGRNDDLEAQNRQLQEQRDRLDTELAESQGVVRNLTDSPTPSSTDAENVNHASIETAELNSQLNACHAHGEQLQKDLDDAHDEKEKLRDYLSECKTHGKELSAVDARLEHEAAEWKKQFEDEQARTLSGTETDDHKDESELTRLRTEVNRLTVENQRLNAAAKRAPDEELDFLGNRLAGFEVENARLNQRVPDLEADNARLVTQNAHLTAEKDRCLNLLNTVRLQNLHAEARISRPVDIKTTITNISLRTPSTATASNNLSTPSAIPLPATPVVLRTGAAPLTGSSLIQPSALRTPRTPAFALPIDAHAMPERWLQRERAIQNSRAFQETKRRILAMLEAREGRRVENIADAEGIDRGVLVG